MRRKERLVRQKNNFMKVPKWLVYKREREQKKLFQKGSKKKSLIVVLKYGQSVTWREIDNVEPAVNQQLPRRNLRHKN